MDGFSWSEWIKQQSTQKAILAAFAALGVYISPEQIDAILTSFLLLYGVLAGFRDKT